MNPRKPLLCCAPVLLALALRSLVPTASAANAATPAPNPLDDPVNQALIAAAEDFTTKNTFPYSADQLTQLHTDQGISGSATYVAALDGLVTSMGKLKAAGIKSGLLYTASLKAALSQVTTNVTSTTTIEIKVTKSGPGSDQAAVKPAAAAAGTTAPQPAAPAPAPATLPLGSSPVTITFSPDGSGATVATGATPPTPAVSPTNAPLFNDVYVIFGAQMLNPYTIKPASGTTPASIASNSTAGSFLAMEFADRLAWDPTRAAKYALNPEPFWENWDFEAAASFNFSSSTQSAASVLGSGTFNAEVTVGKFLYSFETDPNWFHTLDLDMSAGATSDSQSLNNHESYFVGLNNIFGITNNKQTVRWDFRGGYANIRVAKLAPGTLQTVQFSPDGIPLYKGQSCFTFQTELFLPVSATTYLTFGGRTYFHGGSSNPWTAYLGYTVPISGIYKSLFPSAPSP